MLNWQINRWHVRDLLRAYWRPEAVESRRLEHAAITAGIVDSVGCPECFVAAGEPCSGLSAGYHFARGALYAKRPWTDPA